MKSVIDIKRLSLDNPYFREVLLTGLYSQITVMSLNPGEEIRMEFHNADQIIVVVEGDGTVILNEEHFDLRPGSLILVRAGTRHALINGQKNSMKLYTVSAPTEYKQGIIHKTQHEHK